MSMSTKPVRVSKFLGCAFLLQAAVIGACASNTDTGEAGEAAMMGPMTMTPTTPAAGGAGAPAMAAAGRPGTMTAAGAGRPATAAGGTAAPATGGSMAAAAGGSAPASGAAGGAAAAAGSTAAVGGSGAAGSSGGAAGGMAAAAGSTGGAAGGGAAAGGATFTKVYDALFASSSASGCGSCHGAPAGAVNGMLGGLMTKEATHTALVGKMSSSAMCSGKPYVKAGDAEGSLLYEKIAAAPMCGMRMPPGSMVPAADVTLVKDWITAGAKND